MKSLIHFFKDLWSWEGICEAMAHEAERGFKEKLNSGSQIQRWHSYQMLAVGGQVKRWRMLAYRTLSVALLLAVTVIILGVLSLMLALQLLKSPRQSTAAGSAAGHCAVPVQDDAWTVSAWLADRGQPEFLAIHQFGQAAGPQSVPFAMRRSPSAEANDFLLKVQR